MSGWTTLAASIHPGLLCQVAQPQLADGTMAVHHCIRADLHHCTCCGARPEVLDQVLARCGPVGIAVVSCLPCRNADPDRAYMRAVLEARYDAGRFGNNTKGDVDAPTDGR